MSPPRKPKSRSKVKLGDELIRGLSGFRDALRDRVPLHERFTLRTVSLQLEPSPYLAKDVRALREKLGASQAVFARLLGASIRTVQSWEQGRAPPPMARRLLDVIAANPAPWQQLLRQAALPRVA